MYGRAAPQTELSKILIGSNVAARDQWHYAFNLYFLDGVVFGHYNPSIWRKDTPSIRSEWQNKLDFIAPQYYRALDIYHDVRLALKAPWAGGNGVVDLRQSTDYLKKFLWNDLGWTIYPNGLYWLLREFHDRYQLPFLVTENGMAESQDRNRAAYTIAHLQQVLRAIKDGVDIFGYVHWTIADNWEWAFDYMSDAHFGLFTVDRHADPDTSPNNTFPRHITEGALALQYLIANSHRIGPDGQENPFDAPVARFGTYSADGVSVTPPERSPGPLWRGALDMPLPDGWGSQFTLYLSPLPNDVWIGMLFFEEPRHWVRLERITLMEGDTETGGNLSFAHTMPSGMLVTYTGVVNRGSRVANGMADVSGNDVGGSADPVEAFGTWRSDGMYPPFIALRALEADYDGWRGKAFNTGTFYDGKEQWLPGTVMWPATNRLRLDVDTGLLTAELGASGFAGSFSAHRERGEAPSSWAWTGTRLPDDFPF